MNNRATPQTAVQRVTPYLGSLLAATRKFNIPIGQKMELTGWDDGNNMRNATCCWHKNFNWVALLSIPYTVTLIGGVRVLQYLCNIK